MRVLVAVIPMCAWTFPASAADTASAPMFTAAQMRADLAELNRALHEMPADLSHSVAERDLAQAVQQIDSRLAKSAPLTRDQAWGEFATLNPVLADGHLFIGFVDWRGDTRAHLASGGLLFPLPVQVSAGCELRVQGALRGAQGQPLDDARIVAIDGLPAHEVCEQMMARVHGDTRPFRADLLSRRFWFFHWKVFGAPGKYAITFDSGMQEFAGSGRLPDLLAAEADFERQFHLTMLPNDGTPSRTAVLTLGTFAWPDKNQLLAFTRQSFETLRRGHVGVLVLDLRDNGGGDDDQWIEGVMPYIAHRPFRTASTYRKRVVTADPAKHEVAGAVVDGEIETWYPPQPDNPARFSGKVYVAVGPGTYSSAIVMATVIQDFGFGQVVGPADSVRASQSGGTRRTTLTNTGLIVVTPRFVLTRPSGARSPALFRPDIAYLPILARTPP